MTSEDSDESDKNTSDIDRAIVANENREYNVPFDWGDHGQVEVRTIK